MKSNTSNFPAVDLNDINSVQAFYDLQMNGLLEDDECCQIQANY